jgi:hypothetical protein
MRHSQESLLESAIQALKAAEPDAMEISGATKRLKNRLGLDQGVSSAAVAPIESCEDVRQLLNPYREGLLSPSLSLLVEAHLRDCGACLRQHRAGAETTAVDWSAPKTTRAFAWPTRSLAWALAPALALLLCSIFIYRAYWQVLPGVQAEVRSIDGSAYGISKAGDRQLAAGDTLRTGEGLRTSGGAHAVLGLADGSTVEVNERSVVAVGARGHDMTLSLNNGDVIVQAAKRPSGHLYVKTPDCRVAVTGTVFSVDSGIKGSRVAVLQGAVQVTHAGVNTLVHAGDQIATYDHFDPTPVREQIAEQISWSRDRQKYLLLTAQFATLEQRIAAIPFPESRYSSDLLPRVPANTLLYISIPNLGDFLGEANAIFHDQLKQSPALRQWWGRGQGRNTEDLDAMVGHLREISQYLGDEVVIVGAQDTQADQSHPSFAIVADLRKSGLDEVLRSRFSSLSAGNGLSVLDEQSLSTATSLTGAKPGGYALMRQHEVVFSDSIPMLKQVNAQLNAGASGFGAGDFGQQITAAYGRGAGVIVAADLHRMIDEKMVHGSGNAEMEKTGMDGVKYLIAEHRESNGIPQNHLNLQFTGARQRVASWLAAPAPMGSLDFVTPNASFAAAVLTKDPTAIVDDIIEMSHAKDDGNEDDLTEAQVQMQTTLRDDLAANLGGEFLISLDGPVLPTPSWKAVIEVRNAGQLENTLEQLAKAVGNQAQGKTVHGISIDSTEVNGQRFYSVHELASGNVIANYTFADGYMIVTPIRALLFQALQSHANGDSLARSAAFKALLPKDDNDNYSAVAYQNLSPVLTPLLSQFGGDSAEAETIRKLAADARPTTVCAWGKDNRIEAASDSSLFGFDFFTLGSFIHAQEDSRNQLTSGNVKD